VRLPPPGGFVATILDRFVRHENEALRPGFGVLRLPRGRQARLMIELRAGPARTTIDPGRGGRLASLAIDGRQLLLGPPSPDDRSIRWGCFLMTPWPGRLDGGRFEWGGRTIQLPRTHGQHAIHGLGWDRPWRVVATDGAMAALELDLAAAGWPMGGMVRETISLAADRLELSAEVTAGDSPMPAALGWHPWFLRRGGASVRLRAAGVLEVDRMIPTGRDRPVGGRYDLRDGPALGNRRLDDVFVGVTSPITIAWPDLELRIEFGADSSAAVVYTPPKVFCIEPLTAVPNAFNAGTAPVLDAGAGLASRTVFAWGA
jgi:aldose 1-epimerase